MNEYAQNIKPDFDFAREEAYKLLLKQDNPSIGMDIEKIKIPGKTVIFETMQNYCSITNSSMDVLTVNGKLSLGYHLNIGNGSSYLILYNGEINSHCCECWTKCHEIGHICMEHKSDESIAEVETNFFTSCLTMPDAVIRFFIQRGYTASIEFLVQYFNVSTNAAIKKVRTLNKYFPTTKYDEKIIDLFHDDISKIMSEIDSDIQLSYTSVS